MNKSVLFKKMVATVLSVMMLLSMITVNAESDLSPKTLEASYGTPVIDGEIDEIWNSTNYTFIDRTTPSGEYDYTGWMKVLWDENKLYVLAQIHTITLSADENLSPWRHDCLEIFVDENCARTTVCEADDYQLRSNFKGATSSKNYPVEQIEAKTKTFDMGFVVEMAFPLKSVKLKNGLKMGFDAHVNRTSNFAFDSSRIAWNAYRADISSDTSDWGTLILKDSVSVVRAAVPEFSLPIYENYEIAKIPYNDEITLVPDVSAMFNYTNETNVSVLHINEYPCMEISALAQLIGATLENGNILVKDGKRLTYTAGERLMQDNNGNIIMLVEATLYNNQLYVPLSSLETTLLYDINYNRFAKELDVVPFNEPEEAQFIANVKDYGAVGDGITDDKKAILAALNAAVNSGVPSRVELEPNKMYFVGEAMDTNRVFWINSVTDFVFDGNGSTILLSPAQMGAFEVTKSARIRIEDVIIDSTESATTQGTIVGISESDDSVILEFDEGYPLLAPGAWTAANDNKESNFITPIQQGTAHLKYMRKDYAPMVDIQPLGDGTYKAYLNSNGAGMIPYLEEGDRFVANYTYNNYDQNERSRPNSGDAMIQLRACGDVELKNVITRVGKFVGCYLYNTWGNIRFNNFSAVNDDGRIWSNGRDFIHGTYARGTLLWENSTVVGNGDDIINLKTKHTKFVTAHGNRRYTMENNATFNQGDELLIFDVNGRDVVARAFVEEVEYVAFGVNSETAEIVLDRDIEGFDMSSMVAINVSACGSGTVIRNNTFKNGRRWLWINHAPNCIFENNDVENMAASMIAGHNELYYGDAPFPSAFTVRGNNYFCDGNASTAYDPLQVYNDGAEFGDTAAIDGFLLEDNVFELSRTGTVFRIADVNGLYMINNKIINHGVNTSDNMPITIKNCDISLIDGVTLDYDHNGVEYGVNIAGCEYNDGDIKNINILNNNTMKTYKDWWK